MRCLSLARSVLIIYFWLRWVFIAALGLPLVVASRGYSLLRCAGFSLRWLLLLRSMGSRRAGFIRCGSRASVVVLDITTKMLDVVPT